MTIQSWLIFEKQSNMFDKKAGGSAEKVARKKAQKKAQKFLIHLLV